MIAYAWVEIYLLKRFEPLLRQRFLENYCRICRLLKGVPFVPVGAGTQKLANIAPNQERCGVLPPRRRMSSQPKKPAKAKAAMRVDGSGTAVMVKVLLL